MDRTEIASKIPKGVGIMDIERNLGFKWERGMSRAKEAQKVPIIKGLIADIEALKNRFVDYGPYGLRDQEEFSQRRLQLFLHYGPHLWPSRDSRHVSEWLKDADEGSPDPRYPRNLVYSQPSDRETLWQNFSLLLLMKCVRFHDNEGQKKARRERDREVLRQVHAASGPEATFEDSDDDWWELSEQDTPHESLSPSATSNIDPEMDHEVVLVSSSRTPRDSAQQEARSNTVDDVANQLHPKTNDEGKAHRSQVNSSGYASMGSKSVGQKRPIFSSHDREQHEPGQKKRRKKKRKTLVVTLRIHPAKLASISGGTRPSSSIREPSQEQRATLTVPAEEDDKAKNPSDDPVSASKSSYLEKKASSRDLDDYLTQSSATKSHKRHENSVDTGISHLSAPETSSDPTAWLCNDRERTIAAPDHEDTTSIGSELDTAKQKHESTTVWTPMNTNSTRSIIPTKTVANTSASDDSGDVVREYNTRLERAFESLLRRSRAFPTISSNQHRLPEAESKTSESAAPTVHSEIDLTKSSPEKVLDSQPTDHDSVIQNDSQYTTLGASRQPFTESQDSGYMPTNDAEPATRNDSTPATSTSKLHERTSVNLQEVPTTTIEPPTALERARTVVRWGTEDRFPSAIWLKNCKTHEELFAELDENKPEEHEKEVIKYIHVELTNYEATGLSENPTCRIAARDKGATFDFLVDVLGECSAQVRPRLTITVAFQS